MILYYILTKHIITYMHRNYVYVRRYKESDMQLKHKIYRM